MSPSNHTRTLPIHHSSLVGMAADATQARLGPTRRHSKAPPAQKNGLTFAGLLWTLGVGTLPLSRVKISCYGSLARQSQPFLTLFWLAGGPALPPNRSGIERL